MVAQRDAMTVRFPPELLDETREFRKEGESLNQFIVTAVANEVKYRRGKRAIENINEIRERVRAVSGNHPDATPLIRELREGIGRRD